MPSPNCRAHVILWCNCRDCRDERGEPSDAESDALAERQARESDARFDPKEVTSLQVEWQAKGQTSTVRDLIGGIIGEMIDQSRAAKTQGEAA